MEIFDLVTTFTNYLTQNKVDVDQLNKIDSQIDTLFKLNEDMLIEPTLQKSSLAHLYLDNLDPQALNTSYIDLYLILKELTELFGPSSICDLGAGYGRMVNLSQAIFKDIKVTSVEPVKQRLKNSQSRLKKSKHTFYYEYFESIAHKIKCDTIFLYFPTGPILNSILHCIKSNPHIKRIIAIESHGELINRLKLESSWLRAKEFVKIQYPRHNNYSYLFEKMDEHGTAAQTDLEHVNNYLLELGDNKEVLIKQDQEHWLAKLEQDCIHYDSTTSICIEFNSPPRSIKLTSLTQIEEYKSQDKLEQRLITLRNQAQPSPFLPRKLFPKLRLVELASGDLIKYEDVPNL